MTETTRRAPATRRPASARAWFLGGWLLTSCLFDTAPPRPVPARKPRFAYTVEVSGADTVACRVTVEVADWPEGTPLLFQAPPYYADNPVQPVKQAFRAADFHAFDGRGNALPVRDTTPAGLALGGNFIVVPPGAIRIRYAVDHDPADPKRFGLPMPGLAAGVQAFDGAYFFILPVLGETHARHWRTPAEMTVSFALESPHALAGQDPVADVADNYQLMFVRAIIDPVSTSRLVVNGREIVTYAATGDSVDVPRLHGLLEKCLHWVEDSLLPLPDRRWFAGAVPVYWGLEGNQGHWFRPDAAIHAYVHTHELLHTFIGVRHGDLDDPWWKEGVTNYLGELLPLQHGMYDESTFVADFCIPRDTVRSVREFALAHPRVRIDLFHPLDSAYQHVVDSMDFGGLVYGKGAGAAMIIDRFLLENSDGAASLFHLVRSLVEAHGPAFTRADLVARVSALARQDSRAFLENLLDTPGPLSKDSLEATYLALKMRGRFLPAIPPGPLPKRGARPPRGLPKQGVKL